MTLPTFDELLALATALHAAGAAMSPSWVAGQRSDMAGWGCQQLTCYGLQGEHDLGYDFAFVAYDPESHVYLHDLRARLNYLAERRE